MNEIEYGFVNQDDLLIGNAFFIEGDSESLERVKKEYGASNYYPLNGAVPYLESCYWNGTTFSSQKPFDSWSWDSVIKDWAAPKPYPQDGKTYYWDEIEIDWVLVQE